MDPSAQTAASFQPKTEFEALPPQNQSQQHRHQHFQPTTSTGYQAVNTLPQIKAEPADANQHSGQDRHAVGRQMRALQNQVKEEDEGGEVNVGEGQQGGCICEICGRGCWSETHLKSHKSYRHGNDLKAKRRQKM